MAHLRQVDGVVVAHELAQRLVGVRARVRVGVGGVGVRVRLGLGVRVGLGLRLRRRLRRKVRWSLTRLCGLLVGARALGAIVGPVLLVLGVVVHSADPVVPEVAVLALHPPGEGYKVRVRLG